MAKKLKKIRNKAGISLCSSAAILMGALYAHQAYAQVEDASDAESLESEVTDASESSPEVETTVLDSDGGGTLNVESSDDSGDVVVADSVDEEQDEVADSADEVEEVVVYGIKQSLSTAQDLKRDAATVIDAVTASDIMSLPDKSVVDALTRVPGVTVEVFEATDDPEHFGAEGSTALVRGLNRTLTQFNGRTSFSATQFGALNLSHIPSELVGAIEVQKNQTASMIEGGIAGTLNLVTRKPFDNPGRQLGGSIKVDYADVADEWSPSLSGLFSDRWETGIGEIGFLVSVSWSETYSASQAVGTHDYYERSTRKQDLIEQGVEVAGTEADYVGPPLNGQGDGVVLWQPPSIQARYKEDERERLGFATSLQWQNTDETLKATLEFIRSDGHAVWTERLAQNKDQLGSQQGNSDVAAVLEIPGLSGVNESFDPETGLFTHGVLTQAGADDYGYAPETRYHDEETYVNDLSLDIEWRATDSLTINGDFQYVDSGQRMFDHTIHSFFRSDVWLDFREPESPQIGFLGENFHLLTPTEASSGSGTFFQDANGNLWGGDLTSITDPENVHTRSAMDHDTDSQGDALAFAVDADYEFDEGWLTNIKAGFRVSDRKQVHKSTEYDWGVISPEWSDAHRRSLADYSGSEYPQFQERWDFGSDFYGGDAFVPGTVTSFYFPRLEWVKDLTRFEDAYRSIEPIGYDPGADPDSQGADDDPTWYYSLNDGATDPFITTERRVVTGKAPGSPFSPYHLSEVNERNSAVYVQLDFDFIDLPWPIRGNVGLRYVDIDVTTTGYRIFNTPEEAGTWADPKRYDLGSTDITDSMPDDLRQYLLDNAAEYERAVAADEDPVYRDPAELEWLNGYMEKIDIKPDKYQSILPSLNLTMNIREDVLLRFAASKAVYVPHLSLKRPSIRYTADVSTNAQGNPPTGWDQNERGQPLQTVTFQNYIAQTVGGSNPYLDPEESINIDFGAEWYFSDVGSLTGVLFTKEMDNLIRKTSVDISDVNPLSGQEKEFSQADTYQNVGSGRINGFEISYQQTYDMLPGFWSGLGLQANYTRLYTSEDIDLDVNLETFGTFVDLPLEGLSPESYNIIGFYENENFSTRLAYNFRSEYMLNSRDVIGKRPVYNKDRGVLDFSFTYTFENNIKAGFDINNLTDEQTQTIYQYDEAGNTHPRNYFINDRRITFRVSASI